MNEESAPRRSLPRRVLRRIPGLRRFLCWLGDDNSTIVPHKNGQPQPRLLEIGCGRGGYLSRVRDAGWQVQGVEPGDDAAQLARSDGLDVHTGTLDSFEATDESYDAIAMWQVLEHVPNPVETLADVRRLLKPGGQYLLGVPNAACIEPWIFGRFWMGYDAPRHLQVFKSRRLVRLLKDAGFTHIHVIHQSNTRFWFGSLAAWGQDRFPDAKWPDRWMGYFLGEPPGWMRWSLLIPGKLIWLLHCSGRITVVARKPIATK